MRHPRHASWVLKAFLLVGGLSVLTGWPTQAWAQERLGIEQPPRLPGLGEPSFPPEQMPPVLPRPELPPIPLPPPEERERLPMPRVFVRRIRIIGSTVFPRQSWRR